MKNLMITAIVGLLACGVTACGKDSPTAPSPATPAPTPAPPSTPAPAPTSPFAQTFTGNVPNYGESFHRVTAPSGGTANFNLEWNNNAVDLDLGLTTDACVNFYADSCVHLGDTFGVGTTEHLARPVAAGTTYRIWVVNYAHQEQPYTLGVTIQ